MLYIYSACINTYIFPKYLNTTLSIVSVSLQMQNNFSLPKMFVQKKTWKEREIDGEIVLDKREKKD